MLNFWMIGVVSAVGIGAAIGLITAWIGGNRLSRTAGCVLVFLLSVAYHTLAALGPLHILTQTIIVPWGFGFGEGKGAFGIALLVQTMFATVVGIGIYQLINKRK